MGTLAPHLSQRADIPHLTAITPVRLDFGVITRSCCSWTLSSDAPSTNTSAVPNLLKKKKNGYGAVLVVVVVVVLVALDARSRRREIRPLDKADMVSDDTRSGVALVVVSERERREAVSRGAKEGLYSGTVGVIQNDGGSLGIRKIRFKINK
jgi:hypothetical protein